MKIGIFSKFVFFETIYWEKTLHLTKKLTLGFEAFPLMCVNRRLEKRKKCHLERKLQISLTTKLILTVEGSSMEGVDARKRKYWCHLSESPILELFEKSIYTETKYHI